MPRWEYCVIAPAPPGPVQVTITFYHTSGAERRVYNAKDYTDGSIRLWSQLIAELGLDGWELVAAHMDALYFKRPLADDTEA